MPHIRKIGSHRLRRSALAAALYAACISAQAQTASDPQTQQRLAELEALVRTMQSEIQVLRAEQTAPRAAAVETGAKPAETPAKPAIQRAPIVPRAHPGANFSFGGFVRVEGIYTKTSDGEIPLNSLGRRQYAPASIPVGGNAESSYLSTTAQHSRFWFTVDSTTQAGDKVKGHIEMDFGTDINGNQVSTNSYTPRIRHAYVSWNNWLAGQFWTNFQEVSVLPEAGPLLGPTEGTVFVRQVQLRYTQGPWSFSIENPETTLSTGPARGRVNSDDNNLPDLTAKYTRSGENGLFSAAGLVRQLRYDTPGGGTDTWGYGVSLAGKWKLGPRDEIGGMFTAGRGISRYLGYGVNPDAVIDTDRDLAPISMAAGFLGWKHWFGDRKLRSNLYVSMASYDIDRAWGDPSLSRSTRSAHLNLVYSPVPNIDVGSELLWGRRKIEGGDSGELYRVHSFVRYSF